MSRDYSRATRRGGAGFTAIEAMISVAVMGLLVLIAVTMFQTSNKISRKASEQGDLTQVSRVAMDMLTRDLRAAGYGLDVGGGQQALVFAAPWDIVFNGNVTPTTDDPTNPGFPRAIDLARVPATIPPAGGAIYTPTSSFSTGAETIRFTLDSSGDGAVSAADQGDDAEEATANPRDFVLRKEIYGAATDGTNGGSGETVGMVRGPLADTDGTLPTPLFQYWLDDDNDISTPEVLWGDADSDGALSQAEIAALTPVPAASLALVTRTIVTVTAEDGSPDATGDFRTRVLSSSVGFRNMIRRTGVITGIVFQDEDADGEYDVDTEVPIPNVTVRLSTGTATTTNTSGRYVFDTPPGTYTVTELDPSGYASTTSNAVSISIGSGETGVVNFGDRPASGVGTITGKVYEDVNANGVDDDGIALADVIVTLHTGQVDTTDVSGVYSFIVPVGSYTVVEADPDGYGSTTPNAVDVLLTADGETQQADFGDIVADASGTIEGTVFLDANDDGILDPGENGIADVPVTVVGVDSTVTDGNGLYSFTVPVGRHDVYEYDLPGFSSSTPNLVRHLLVEADSTVIVDFGDIADTDVNFTVVVVGTADRALSVVSADLQEDNKGDSDIILGTQLTSGGTNLHGWHNQRKNSGTAITALFDATPSYSRSTGYSIPAMLAEDFSLDGVPDVLVGLDSNVGNNLQVWTTLTSGATKGMPGNTPTSLYSTTSGSSVLCLARAEWPGWARPVILVGTETASGGGRVEVWVDSGGGSLAHVTTSDILYDGVGALNRVTALAVGNLNGDAYPDLVVGEDQGGYQGRVAVYMGSSSFTWAFDHSGDLDPSGAVLSLACVDMREDGDGDDDILAGTSIASGAGHVDLWTNDEGNFGTPDTSGTGGRIVSDWVDAGGEVMSMGTALLDPDVFPDVIAGIRTGTYSGELHVYRGTGYLPSTGADWANTGSGEIVTLTVDDFDIDGLLDIAVGTRTAASTGELVVYFGQ